MEDLKRMLEALEQVGGRGFVAPAAWGMFSYRLPPMVSPRSREGDVEGCSHLLRSWRRQQTVRGLIFIWNRSTAMKTIC